MVREVLDLTSIFDPGVNVVTLQRGTPRALAEDAKRAVELPGFRRLFTVGPAVAAGIVSDELSEFPCLAEDVRFWVECIAELADAERVGVRLARLDSPMCPRFHVDRVTMRLVTTYQGLGTEFVSNEHVDRRHLGHAALGIGDEASGLLRVGHCVRAAEPFDVVVLKGEAWPDNAGRGAVHRSPSASAGSPRLVMTLDPL